MPHDMPPTGPKADRMSHSASKAIDHSRSTGLNVQDALDKWNHLRSGESFNPQTLDPTNRPGLAAQNAELQATNLELKRKIDVLMAQKVQQERLLNELNGKLVDSRTMAAQAQKAAAAANTDADIYQRLWQGEQDYHHGEGKAGNHGLPPRKAPPTPPRTGQPASGQTPPPMQHHTP